MNNCNARGFQKGACQSATMTLRDYIHIGNITGTSMHTRHWSRVGAVATHKGGVGFLPTWKQLCRHAQNVEWGDVRAAVGGAYSWEINNLGGSLKHSAVTGWILLLLGALKFDKARHLRCSNTLDYRREVLNNNIEKLPSLRRQDSWYLVDRLTVLKFF